MELRKWPAAGSSMEEAPWSYFAAARESLERGDPGAARQRWLEVLRLPALESRHYLQAWTFLRLHGEQPTGPEAKHVYGVVFEVGMDEGLDLLAAYQDHSARYYNYSGAGVIWDHPDDRLNGRIDELLAHSAAVVQRIGPWDKPRRPAPDAGQMRMTFLTPSGLHFGEGTMKALSRYPLAVPVINGALELMRELVGLQP